MDAANYASLDSQLGDAPCRCEDTEEMFWLRESDDYESRVRLGNLLSGQYRFREALDAYRSAARIRGDDPALWLRMGGAHLTLRHFDEAKAAYDRSCLLSGSEKTAAFQMGVWHYLRGDYRSAAERFAAVPPCSDELLIAVLYWHALSCMRNQFPDGLITAYRDGLQVGHHTAYRSAVELFLGRISPKEAFSRAAREENDLDAVILLYGLSRYFAHGGDRPASEEAMAALLRRESVWPCISYLAAWNDRCG